MYLVNYITSRLPVRSLTKKLEPLIHCWTQLFAGPTLFWAFVSFLFILSIGLQISDPEI